MSDKNKAILEEASAAVGAGDYEKFLSFRTDNTKKWIFVGDQTLKGKEAVRRYMAETYVEPPKFMVEKLLAKNDFVTAIGEIILKDKNGKETRYFYCDNWRFRDGKMAELKAFVIESENK